MSIHYIGYNADSYKAVCETITTIYNALNIDDAVAILKSCD